MGMFENSLNDGQNVHGLQLCRHVIRPLTKTGPHAGMLEPTLALLFERVVPALLLFSETDPQAGMVESTLAPQFECKAFVLLLRDVPHAGMLGPTLAPLFEYMTHGPDALEASLSDYGGTLEQT